MQIPLQAPPMVLPAQETIRVVERYVPQEQYIAALERASGQLGTLWTVAGVFVGALGVLFALGAIAAALLLYRQSQDYQRQIDRHLERANEILGEFLENTEARHDEIVAALRQRAEDAATDEARKAFQEAAKRVEANTPRPPALGGRPSFGKYLKEMAGTQSLPGAIAALSAEMERHRGAHAAEDSPPPLGLLDQQPRIRGGLLADEE